MWDVYADEGDHQRALAAVTPVPATSSWARQARFLAGLSQLNLKKYDDAYGTFTALADEDRRRRSSTTLASCSSVAASRPQSGSPTFYFNKASQADPDDQDYVFNLGYAYLLDRDPQASIYWLRESVRRNPADGDAHFVLGAALAGRRQHDGGFARARAGAALVVGVRAGCAAGGRDRATRARAGQEITSSCRTSATSSRAWRRRSSASRPSSRRSISIAAVAVSAGERPRGGQRAESRAVSLALPRRRTRPRRPHHLRNGRLHEAIDAFKIALWSTETAEAHAALGEAYRQAKELDAARAEAERALAMDPESVDAKELLARLDAR
jgi:tetratricopeptide (TPR) repeat protein